MDDQEPFVSQSSGILDAQQPQGPCDTALELTSFLVNFGEWSFLSSITMVAVAVPVNPTSNPAIS